LPTTSELVKFLGSKLKTVDSLLLYRPLAAAFTKMTQHCVVQQVLKDCSMHKFLLPDAVACLMQHLMSTFS